jgi:hypothetical protein
VRYIATHCDGSKLRKALKALRAGLAFMARLLTGRVDLLHVHIASDASFWRKSFFIIPAHSLGYLYRNARVFAHRALPRTHQGIETRQPRKSFPRT